MADQDVDQDVQEPESLDEDRRSMAYMLENPEEAPQFTAAPAPGLEEPPVGGDEETAEAKAAREAAEAEAAKAPPVKEEPPAFKYKSHEEAEAGAREHQRFATEKAEEAKREKEAREAAEVELAEFRAEKQRLAEEAAAKPPEEPVKPVSAEERKAKLKGVSKQFYAKVDALDRTEDDYNEQVAEALADTLFEAGFGAENLPGPNQEEIQKMVSKQVQDALDAAGAAKTEADRQKAAEDEGTRLYNQAVDQAKAAGLDMSNEETADHLLFEAVRLRKVNNPDYLAKPFDEQVQEVISDVITKKGGVIQQTDEQRRAAQEVQRRNAVLGGGNNAPPKSAPPQKRSMMDMYSERDAS